MDSSAPDLSRTVRPSAEGDLPAIQAIYAHHVRTGLASFEEAPPDLAEMARRRTEIVARGLPHLVAEVEGRVLGYAYAGLYRPRSAYRFTVEDSVYIDAAAVGRGLGGLLLAALIADCTAQRYRQMVAVIGNSGHVASITLHERAGFGRVGTFRSVGFKFGRWVDTVLMQRPLGPGDETPPVERA